MNDPRPKIASTEASSSGTHTTQYAIVGVVAGIFFPVIAVVIKLAQLGLPFTIPNAIMVQEVEPVLWITDTAPLFLGLVAGLAGRRQDVAEQANRSLLEREAELTAARSGLEQSVRERTQELDTRNAQMRAVVEFARQVAEIQDLPSLLNMSVGVLAERFRQYDADLYLLDDSGRSVILRASSTSAGKGLVQDGFRIAIGDQTPVGRVARRGKLLVSQPRPPRAGTAGTAPAAMPLTKVTLPLMARNRVIGVLELSSREPLSVGPAETEIFQLIADQLAGAIENARLVTTSRATVNQLESLASQGTRNAWREYLAKRDLAYQFTPAGVGLVSGVRSAESTGAHHAPIQLRGQRIGSLVLNRRGSASWTDSERELVEKVAVQVALALENARLLEETSQKAAQEQVISEISARLNRSLEVDAVLQAAVREFAALPEVAEAEVRLSASDAPSSGATR